jgi:hypothetical protein
VILKIDVAALLVGVLHIEIPAKSVKWFVGCMEKPIYELV